ncbi:MAG: Hsp20/alpha crystallin family protein [Deltaproteobacteria bacterium]|nr:Hsp20/alpha crystallin family protein [Deltaproteobacteria bacterium]MBW2121760.1 Hsp20/alpha crystallin family protein [Deltaproteobacteria bacterium]
MLPILWDPFTTISLVEDEVDDLFDELSPIPSACVWSPPVRVSEDDKRFTVRAELPGIDPKDIQLSIEDHHMTLKGEKKSEKSGKGRNDLWTECFYGSFSRTFRLPETVETKKIKARLKNGVLEISLPKRAEAKPKKISVEMN